MKYIYLSEEKDIATLQKGDHSLTQNSFHDEIKHIIQSGLSINSKIWKQEFVTVQHIKIKASSLHCIVKDYNYNHASIQIILGDNLDLAYDDNHKVRLETNTYNLIMSTRRTVQHFIYPDKEYEFLRIMFRDNRLEQEKYCLHNDISKLVDVSDTIDPNFHHIIKQILNCNDFEELAPVYLDVKINEIICKIHASMKQKQSLSLESKRHGYINQVEKAKKIIESRYTAPPTIEEIASEVGMSCTLLKTKFKSIYGQTIHSYLTKVRLDIACSLLQTQYLSINEIASESGYEYTSHFVKTFKKHYGVSPGAYRINNCNHAS